MIAGLFFIVLLENEWYEACLLLYCIKSYQYCFLIVKIMTWYYGWLYFYYALYFEWKTRSINLSHVAQYSSRLFSFTLIARSVAYPMKSSLFFNACYWKQWLLSVSTSYHWFVQYVSILLFLALRHRILLCCSLIAIYLRFPEDIWMESRLFEEERYSNRMEKG